jgi:hypothetical protein
MSADHEVYWDVVEHWSGNTGKVVWYIGKEGLPPWVSTGKVSLHDIGEAKRGAKRGDDSCVFPF